MYLWLITQVEYEDMWKTKTGETRGKKTRTLEDDMNHLEEWDSDVDSDDKKSASTPLCSAVTAGATAIAELL